MKTIKDRLRDLREDNDLSQKQVAAVLGIAQQHYSKYENGVYDLPIRHLITLAQYYNVSADYLLGRNDVTTTPESRTYLTRTCSCDNLLRRVLSLNDEGRCAIVEYISLLELKYKVRQHARK